MPVKELNSKTPTGWHIPPSDELNGASTVAYVPKALKGHAVMVAVACEEIVMSPAATMGDAGGDEKVVSNTMLAAYEEIARSRHTVPPRWRWACSTSPGRCSR